MDNFPRETAWRAYQSFPENICLYIPFGDPSRKHINIRIIQNPGVARQNEVTTKIPTNTHSKAAPMDIKCLFPAACVEKLNSVLKQWYEVQENGPGTVQSYGRAEEIPSAIQRKESRTADSASRVEKGSMPVIVGAAWHLLPGEKTLRPSFEPIVLKPASCTADADILTSIASTVSNTLLEGVVVRLKNFLLSSTEKR
ncbi:uncharacterized protein BT62DRAFT_1014178 [Guyanagaster necrorhizus]|uniref:Uncharacterized protein n=1 Tax=Guyanagaster necrorhizus TaxID=856835 RepID=A0A9P7VFM3_9AGAR|nr:uncharacterized protein BT62DRAFT_1014178 [Guyanagaster necrorhizus MCA 3950]KAG7439271.1 hypothetical protein BT62DRAFT_1014178 [Guyanagaster necrorhizus MCA 3950]